MKKYIFAILFLLAISFVSLDVALATVIGPGTDPLPTTTDQCKDGEWYYFNVFKNQGDCVSYVATDYRNPPAY